MHGPIGRTDRFAVDHLAFERLTGVLTPNSETRRDKSVQRVDGRLNDVVESAQWGEAGKVRLAQFGLEVHAIQPTLENRVGAKYPNCAGVVMSGKGGSRGKDGDSVQGPEFAYQFDGQAFGREFVGAIHPHRETPLRSRLLQGLEHGRVTALGKINSPLVASAFLAIVGT